MYMAQRTALASSSVNIGFFVSKLELFLLYFTHSYISNKYKMDDERDLTRINSTIMQRVLQHALISL